MTIIAPSSARISLAGQDRESSASKRYPPRATVSDGRGLVPVQHQATHQSASLGRRQQVGQTVQQRVSLHHSRFGLITLLRRRQIVDCERAKAEGVRLAIGI